MIPRIKVPEVTTAALQGITEPSRSLTPTVRPFSTTIAAASPSTTFNLS